MLGKLLKYEFKATGRMLLPLYGAMILAGLVSSFVINRDAFGATQVIFTMVYVGICVAALVITLLLVIQRFNKNLLSDEGYLMFTLPVSTDSLIFSKLIVAVCWGIIGTIAGILSGIALFATIIPWGDIPEMIRFIVTHMDAVDWKDWLMLVEVLVSCILDYALFVMVVYTSLSVGQLPFAGKHRKAASLGAFFLIYIIYTILISVTGGSLSTADPDTWIFSLSVVAQMGLAILVEVVLIAVMFFITRFILNRHLNLE
ncbi:MAG: hypothetical protein U0M15_01655 [Bacillota bacterium]|nr:hypothetical protein [Bacillota bacterium]